VVQSHLAEGKQISIMTQINRVVIGGVDTHKDVHVAAVIDEQGRILGTQDFQTNKSGYQELLQWMESFGTVGLIGVEGTGCYGAGLSQHLAAKDITVVEVNRANRQMRRMRGKSDVVDAEAAARAALNRQATAIPKEHDAIIESIRVIRVAFTSARHSRTRVSNQIRDLIVTAPEQLRSILGGLATAERVGLCSRFRPGDPSDCLEANKLALRTLAKRYEALTAEMKELNSILDGLTAKANPALRSIHGVGPDVAAILLIAAGDNPERLRNESAFAALCGVSPVQASSGKTSRHRLNRAGNRQANHALWRIGLVRSRSDSATKEYIARRTAQGKSKREIMRCLKRYIAREVFRILTKPEAIVCGPELREARNAAGITLNTAAVALETRQIRISRIERSLDFDRDFVNRYQAWLTAQQAA